VLFCRFFIALFTASHYRPLLKSRLDFRDDNPPATAGGTDLICSTSFNHS
jgi:hypothetical protein